jgi:cobalt/nickel transport system permease protein
MTAGLHPPVSVPSLLSRLDPRWRLVGLLVLMLGVAGCSSLPGLGIGLLSALTLAFVARVPWRWARGQVTAALVLLALFAAPLALMGRAGEAILLVGKGTTILLLSLVLLTTAPVETTLHAAHALRVPGLLVQIALLSYRYIFLLGDELARLRIALRLRGFRNAAGWHSYRTVGNLAGTLMVRGSDRAERVAQAMRCRGFDGQFRSLTEFHTTLADVLAFALLAMLAVLVLVVG